MPLSSYTTNNTSSVKKGAGFKFLASALILAQPTFTNAGIFDHIQWPPLTPPPTPAPTTTVPQEPQGAPSPDMGLEATPSPGPTSEGSQGSQEVMTTMSPAAIPNVGSAYTRGPIIMATRPPSDGGGVSSTGTAEASGGGADGDSLPFLAGDAGTYEGSSSSPPPSSPYGAWSTRPSMTPTAAPSEMYATGAPSGASDDLLLMTGGPSSMNIDDTTTRGAAASGGVSPIKNATTPWKALPFSVAAAAAVSGVAAVFSWFA